MIAVKFIFPALISSFRTGATLPNNIRTAALARGGCIYALVGVCGVNDHGIFRFIVNNQVGVIVASARPCDPDSVAVEQGGDR
jgi:hypothetical protein